VIRSEQEYEQSRARAGEQAQALKKQRAALAARGCSAAEVRRGMAPLEAFHAQLLDELDEYERARKGDLSLYGSLEELGHALIAARISRGLSQRELAGRLNVPESQVSRDEKQEYHGISVYRAVQVLQALGVDGGIQLRPVLKRRAGAAPARRKKPAHNRLPFRAPKTRAYTVKRKSKRTVHHS
jgi:transcriptional regulator with XRE-family HTH domain